MTSRPKAKRLRFYNPIAGKPTPVNLSSLFLVDPASLTKLYGFSLRGLIVDATSEKLYKKLDRVSKGKQPAKPSMLSEMLALFPSEHSLKMEFEAIAAGDEDAAKRLDAMGLWELYLLGANNGRELSARARFIIGVERACRRPEELLRQGAFSEAAALLAGDELLSLFLWPDALEHIKCADGLAALLPLQTSVALEVLLSILAARDVEAGESESIAQCVMPSVAQPGFNPTQLFFKYLLKESGASTIQALVDHERLRKLSLELSTLKRWSAGSHYPDRIWLMPIIKALSGDADYSPAWNRFWAARYLNFIGYLAQTASTRAQKFVGGANESLLWPWPAYPFGFACFEGWVAARYPVWLRYHRQRAAGG